MPFKVLIPVNKMRMPGRKVTKISSMFFRGPVTVKIGHTQIALGFGMSKRIMVEVDLKE